jgi:hypothetical protein
LQNVSGLFKFSIRQLVYKLIFKGVIYIKRRGKVIFFIRIKIYYHLKFIFELKHYIIESKNYKYEKIQ